MRRVGEIMIPIEAYPRVRTNDTLRDAIDVIKEAQLEVNLLRSLPRVLLVFDVEGQLAGQLRRRDIMRGLEPRFLVSRPLEYRKKLFDVSVDPNLSELSYDRMVRGVREQASRLVSEVMRPVKMTIDYEDHLIKAVYEMVTGDVSTLPVLQDKRLVGVVRSVEVFQELVQILR